MFVRGYPMIDNGDLAKDESDAAAKPPRPQVSGTPALFARRRQSSADSANTRLLKADIRAEL